MKRIYIIIAGIFLIILIVVNIILSLLKKSTINTQKNSLFPTSIPRQGSVNQQTDQQVSPQNNQSSSNTVSGTGNGSSIDISTIVPVETEDFKLQFSPQLNKIVVEKKTSQAEQKFTEWADQNNYPQLINNPDLVSIVNQGQAPSDFNPLIEFLNIFMNFGQQNQSNQPTPANSPTSYPNLTPLPTYSGNTSGKIYYAQCGGDYGSTPLPGGCNLCFAGCGPTTVAMIASSYLNPSYNPKTIVDLYQSNGYVLGCDGSNWDAALYLLQKLGLKTIDPIVYGYVTADQVVPDIRNYLAGGWAVFTLVKGHFFWIVDVDSQGNIFAYDPAHSPVPYNENSYSPSRLYRVIFGVKK